MLRWYLKDKNGTKFVKTTKLPFRDYFFCTEKQRDLIYKIMPEKQFAAIEMPPTHKFARFKHKDEKVYAINLHAPYQKKKIAVKLEEETGELVSEADVSYIDLMLKDLGIKTYVKFAGGLPVACGIPEDFPPLRIAYFDFETDDRQRILKESKYESFAKPDVARILSCAVTDALSGETWYYTNEFESFLLEELVERLNKYDVLQAWNGEDFDFKFFKRFKDIGFNPDMFILLDAMKIHEMLNPKERGHISLDMMAQRYLDVRKIQHEWTFYEGWKEHPEEFEKYNRRDTEIMKQLEDKLGYAGIVLQTAEQVGFLPQKYTYSRYSSIMAIMRMSIDHYGDRIIWKTKSVIPVEEAFQGATVMDSIAGRWKNVVGIDLASLYNNIIQTWNISPEQLLIDGEDHNYNRFDREGIMSKALRQFEVLRNEYKDKRNAATGDSYKLYDQIQAGLKIILLSIYGGLGARGSTRAKEGQAPSGGKSFYNWYCANDVTRYAREIIESAKTVVEEMGYKIVYGDTDSLYIELGEDDLSIEEVKEKLNSIVEATNKHYAEMLEKDEIPVERRRIRMEPQGFYSPFILFGKKKYYFAKEIYNAENDYVNEELEMYAKGVKMIKLSEPMFIREFQERVYKRVLNNQTFDQIERYINKIEHIYIRGNFDSKLIFENKLAKKIEDYATMTPHVRLAAELINKGLMPEKGTLFYKIGHVDAMTGRAVAVVEEEEMQHSGRNYVWEHRIKGWVDEILDLIDDKQTGLDEFW